jgi:hypothetical protein
MMIRVAVQSKVRTVFNRVNSGVECSNTTRSLDLCPSLLSILCCSVKAEALRWVHHPSMDSYYVSK